MTIIDAPSALERSAERAGGLRPYQSPAGGVNYGRKSDPSDISVTRV
jgi:hypothetical protein